MTCILADRSSRHYGPGKFQIDGIQVNHIATQKSRRTVRAGKTNYIYECDGVLLYNWNPNMYAWSTFGDAVYHRGKKYDPIVLIRGDTPEAIEWREINGYVRVPV